MSLTLKEAAEFLKLHPNTVQERAKRGMIPGAAKPGKRWVFLEDGLREYILSISPCRSTVLARHGTLTSVPKGAGLDAVLGLPIRGRRRLTTNA